MTPYERVLKSMGSQLDENQKKRLRDAAQMLDRGNAETRRTVYANTQTGIRQDTEALSSMGLAGNAYSGFQSGEQQRRVNTRQGVFDMTRETLATNESKVLTSYGKQLIEQKRAEIAARRQQAALLAQQRAGLSLNPLVAEKRAFDQTQKAETKAVTPAKLNPWQAAYSVVEKNLGVGPAGIMNLITQSQQQFKTTQKDLYDAARTAGGAAKADTMFGLNPVKNFAEAKKATIAAESTADFLRKQQEMNAPIDKKTGTESIAKMDARLDELDFLITQAQAKFQYVRNAEQQNAALENLNALKAEKETLEDERKQTDRRMKATVYQEYMNLAENPDFAKKAKADETEQDMFYRGINGLSSESVIADTKKSKRVSLMPTAMKGYNGGREAGQYLTDEEKDVYNYIFATKGADAAEAYVEDLRTVINARYAGKETERFANMADDMPILASAMSIFGTLAKTAGAAYSYTAGREIDPNSPYFMGSRLNQVIRSEVAANIAEGVGRLDRYSPAQLMKMGYTQAEIDRMMSGEQRAAGAEAVGNAMGFLYQTGMSVADFLLIAQTGSAASLTIMGTGAAADTVMSAKQRGASDGDALALGTVAGIAEVFFEKFSLDNFYKMSTAGRNAILKNTLAQMGIEASEEFFTECTNILADMYIMGDNGNTRLRVNAYKATGMSQKEAEREAHWDNFEQVMLAALGGAISGGMIGAGKTAGMRIVQSVRSDGVLDLTNPDTIAELDQENARKRAKAEQDAAQDAAKRVQSVKLEDLKATDENPVKATLLDVAAAELKGKGEPDSIVAEVKAAMDKSMKGEPLTAEERFIIISNPTIREAFNITEEVPKMRTGLKTQKDSAIVSTGGLNDGSSDVLRNQTGDGSGIETNGTQSELAPDAGNEGGGREGARADEGDRGSGRATARSGRVRRSLQEVSRVFKNTDVAKQAEQPAEEAIHLESTQKFAESYNKKISSSKSEKPIIEEGDIKLVSEITQQENEYLRSLKGLTGRAVYLYTTKSGRTDIPKGFADSGRSYAMYTPENASEMVFNAAHEHAHNMPDVLNAGISLVRELPDDVINSYIASRKGDIEAKTKAQYRVEFVCDVFGAYAQEIVTGNTTAIESLGISESTAERLYNAFSESMQGASIAEEDLENLTQESVVKTFGGDALSMSENEEPITADVDSDVFLDEAMALYKAGVKYLEYINRPNYDRAVSKALRSLWDVKRTVRVMRKALNLFADDVKPVEYWQENQKNFKSEEHQVQLQLIGMYLRNDVDMGGRFGDKSFTKVAGVVAKAPQYSSLRLSVTSPIRAFENMGKTRKEDSDEARILNFISGERMKDAYVGYLMNQHMTKNAFTEQWGAKVVKAFEGGTTRDASIAQLIGEQLIGRQNAEEAIYDDDHMIVRAFDGWFVFEKGGKLKAFCDGGTTFTKDAELFDLNAWGNKFKPNETVTQKLKKRTKREFQRIDDSVIQVEKFGNNAKIRIPGISGVIEIKNGKSPNVEIAMNTAAVLKEFYQVAWELQSKVLVENGYRPAGYIEDYFPHFWEEVTGVNAAIKKLISYELPTPIAGATSVFKPGKPWASHLLERTGPITEFNAIQGFNKYNRTASDVIFMTPVIQRLRQLESHFRKSASPSDTNNNMYAAWMREYTNGIANKKAAIDRGVEDLLGREGYAFSDVITTLISRSAVQGNVSSAMSNLISYIAALPTTDPRFAGAATKEALLQTAFALANSDHYDGFADKIPFLKMRYDGYETILTDNWKKALRVGDKTLGIMFAATDRFSTEAVARAKFYELRSKGMTEEHAAMKTSEYCLELFADRSKGMAPILFNSKFLKPFSQFTLESMNSMSHFRDIHRMATAEIYDKLTEGREDLNADDISKALETMDSKITGGATGREWIRKFMYLVMMSLWGALTRELIGRDQTWNPFGMMLDFVTDAKEDGAGQAVLNLGGSVVEQLPMNPFGGRIPMASGGEKVKTVFEELGKGIAGEGWNWDDIGMKALWAILAFTPVGGQTKKIIEGAGVLREGGSFRTTKDGEKLLQFQAPDTLGEKIKTIVFGKWASDKAQEYAKNPKLLTQRETEGWNKVKQAGIDEKAYFNVMAALKEIKTTKDEYGNTIEEAAVLKRRALMNMPDLTAEQKQMFDKYLISKENGRIYDYSNAALLELDLMGKSTYDKAVAAQRQGIAPETYLDYAQLKKEYDAANDDLEARGQETVSVNDRMYEAIWKEDSLTTTQKFQLEAAITGEPGWTNKAMLAARAAVRNDKFYELASKMRAYKGKEPSVHAWGIVRADKSLTAFQQLKLQELIGGSDNKTKMDAIDIAGVPKEPAYRYLALYRDYKASDDENELDYSDNVAFKLAVSKERGLSAEDKMKITDAVLGKNSKLFNGWQQANVIASIKPKDYYSFQMKWITLNGKDENGKSVSGLLKRRAKDYLLTLGLTQAQREYLLFNAPGSKYEKW